MGYRQNQWLGTYTYTLYYFLMTFNKPIKWAIKVWSTLGSVWLLGGKFNRVKEFPDLAGERETAHISTKTERGEKIKIKFALSPVTWMNCFKQYEGWGTRLGFRKSKNRRSRPMGRVCIKLLLMAVRMIRRILHTSMYHAMINPTIYGCRRPVPPKGGPKCT